MSIKASRGVDNRHALIMVSSRSVRERRLPGCTEKSSGNSKLKQTFILEGNWVQATVYHVKAKLSFNLLIQRDFLQKRFFCSTITGSCTFSSPRIQPFFLSAHVASQKNTISYRLQFICICWSRVI